MDGQAERVARAVSIDLLRCSIRADVQDGRAARVRLPARITGRADAEVERFAVEGERDLVVLMPPRRDIVHNYVGIGKSPAIRAVRYQYLPGGRDVQVARSRTKSNAH